DIRMIIRIKRLEGRERRLIIASQFQRVSGTILVQELLLGFFLLFLRSGRFFLPRGGLLRRGRSGAAGAGRIGLARGQRGADAKRQREQRRSGQNGQAAETSHSGSLPGQDSTTSYPEHVGAVRHSR